MNVAFADSFWKSLKQLSRHETWWYKIYEFFRRDIPYFLENIWFFRKQLWKHRSWDYGYSLSMMSRSLEKLSNTIELYGQEEDVPRLKKVEKIRRVIELIGHVRSDSYIEMAEKELGKLILHDWEWEEVPENPEFMRIVENDTEEENIHNKKVFDLARKIEDDEWDELFKIIKGQDSKEYREIYDNQTEEEKHNHELWNEWFDGSGMKGWWD